MCLHSQAEQKILYAVTFPKDASHSSITAFLKLHIMWNWDNQIGYNFKVHSDVITHKSVQRSFNTCRLLMPTGKGNQSQQKPALVLVHFWNAIFPLSALTTLVVNTEETRGKREDTTTSSAHLSCLTNCNVSRNGSVVFTCQTSCGCWFSADGQVLPVTVQAGKKRGALWAKSA